MAGRIIRNLRKNMRFAVWLLTCLFLMGMLAGCATDLPSKTYTAQSTAVQDTQDTESPNQTKAGEISEDGSYISKEEVALYLHTYGHLPDNYISKKEAQDLGWDSKKGNLDEAAPGKSIGGSRYGNYEGLLPEKDGRKYYECDLDYTGGYRGAKRLVYSDDGLIFYTEDHYQTFEQLY